MACKYEGTGHLTGRCMGTYEVEPCRGYDKCEAYSPNYISNADCIRAMSDEELAEFLCGVYDEEEDNAKFINGCYIPCYDQYSIKEWLEQPAEEDTE